VLSASVGEPYFSDYTVHELPDSGDQSSVRHSVSSFGTTSHGASSTSATCPEDSHTDEGTIIVNTVLLAHTVLKHYRQPINDCKINLTSRSQSVLD